MFNFINYVRNKWSEYSEHNGKKGTVVDEMAIKPTGYVLTEFYNKLVEVDQTNNISNWESMTDTQMDRFGGKFFIDRVSSSRVSVLVRIRMNKREDIKISENIRAYTASGDILNPTESYIVSKNSIMPSSDAYSLYYIDVLFASKIGGTTSPIKIGDVKRIEGQDFEYISITNVTEALTPSIYENNESYYNRLKYSINDRSVLTRSGIYSILKNHFPGVVSSYVVGPGSKYMTRDLASASYENNSINLTFRGKTPGNNSIKHTITSYVFPPEPLTVKGRRFGYNSSLTDYSYPLTISPSRPSSPSKAGDPAFDGYTFENEVNVFQYSGVYFDNNSDKLELTTRPLLDVSSEGFPFSKADYRSSPGYDWVYGAHGRSIGDFGDVLDYGDSPIKAYGNTIEISSINSNPISVGKKTNKRTGIKASGKFKWADNATNGDNLNIILAGKDDLTVDAFNGIGFGIAVHSKFNEGDTSTQNNASIYFTHSARYDNTQVLATNSDFVTGLVTTENTSALKDVLFTFDPTKEYEFEFTIGDDLMLTAYLRKLDSIPGSLADEEVHLSLSSNTLKAFTNPNNSIYNYDNTYYGTTAKITAILREDDTTQGISYFKVDDFKVVDLNKRRSTALVKFDVTNINTELTVRMRAYANGYGANGILDGYTTYIWDKTASNDGTGVTELNNGGWSILSGVSNQDGRRNMSGDILTHNIREINKYKTMQAGGEFIYMMVVPSGTTKGSIKFYNETLGDVESYLNIEYIDLTNSSTTKYHTNNMVDLYVVTDKSSKVVSENTVTLQYDTFAELSSVTGVKMPINKILNVTANMSEEFKTIIPESQYRIEYDNNERSIYSTGKLYIESDFTPAYVTITYSTHNDIAAIQSYFKDSDKASVYGDILVAHSYPVYIDFNISYRGKASSNEVYRSILSYFDDNSTGTFSISELSNYLYSSSDVNDISSGVRIVYEKTYGKKYTGYTVDSLTILNIEYFSARNITVNKVG